MDKLASDFAKEISKSNGFNELISAFVEFNFGDYLKHARILRVSRDAEVELIKKNLFDKTSTIDKGNIVNPMETEQEPLLNNSFSLLSQSISSDHYRELFTNLISKAFDKSAYPKLHPSFPSIIQQLTPLDAKILANIVSNEKNYTISMNYSYGNDTAPVIVSDAFYDVFLIKEENDKYEDFELTNISINNLVKQGLIELHACSEKNIENDKEYNVEEFAYSCEKYSRITPNLQGGGCAFVSSSIRLTRLGKSFVEMVLE